MPPHAFYIIICSASLALFLAESCLDRHINCPQLKIHCGKKHFEALHDGVEMQVASKWDDFRNNI